MNEHHRITPSVGPGLGALLTITLVVLAACGGSAVRPTPTPIPTLSPAPAYQALVVTPVNDPAVQGHNAYWLYDSATRQAQRIPDQVGGLYGNLRFAPGDRLSAGSYAQIVSFGMDGGSFRREASVPDGAAASVGDYAWSRSGALAYLLLGEPAQHVAARLVIRPVSGTPVTVTLPSVRTVATGGSLRFSPDGGEVLVQHPDLVAQPGGDPGTSTVQVRRVDGSLVFGAPVTSSTDPPAEATWGPDGRIYYRDTRGVNAVTLSTGATVTVLPGVHWYRPDVSPDGRGVVFELRDASGASRLQILDTRTGTVGTTFERADATGARFVSSAEVWFHHGTATKGENTRPLFGYDLVRGTERATGLSGALTDVRPAPAA